MGETCGDAQGREETRRDAQGRTGGSTPCTPGKGTALDPSIRVSRG